MTQDGTPSTNGIGAPGAEDGTLGGYLRVHSRPPAFEGADGQPYTVAIEVERTADLRAPFGAYLVFPRWAETGLGIVGHVETPLLWQGRSEKEVVGLAGETELVRVKLILDAAIAHGAPEDDDSPGSRS